MHQFHWKADRHGGGNYRQCDRRAGGRISVLGKGSGAGATAHVRHGAPPWKAVLAGQAECRPRCLSCGGLYCPPSGCRALWAGCGKGCGGSLAERLIHWATAVRPRGRSLPTPPPRALASVWGSWGRWGFTDLCAVPPRFHLFSGLNCLPCTWLPSWQRTVGMRVLE